MLTAYEYELLPILAQSHDLSDDPDGTAGDDEGIQIGDDEMEEEEEEDGLMEE